MVMSHHGIGLVRPRHAIGPIILHVLPPASQAVQADDQGSHGRHAGHQIHGPVLPASCGRTVRLIGSMPGETLAAQALRGSRQDRLPPELHWPRMLVAHGAAWWAGLCRRRLGSIVAVRPADRRYSWLPLVG